MQEEEKGGMEKVERVKEGIVEAKYFPYIYCHEHLSDRSRTHDDENYNYDDV